MLYWSPLIPWATPPDAVHTPSGRCVTTLNHDYIAKADLVIFHMLTRPEAPSIPRPRGALWAFMSYESPSYYFNRHLDFLEQVPGLNLLVTYEMVADVRAPFAMYVPHDGSTSVLPAGLSSRPRLMVAIISNCSSRSRNMRLQTLRERLGDQAPIDIMGVSSCSNVPFIDECKQDKDGQADCIRALGRIYKFYLAIENSDCDDYITEKTWDNAFNGGMVPVVWGKKNNYKGHLPPDSFINCADYATPSECAAHILQVAGDEALYSSYHAWRLKYRIQDMGVRNDNAMWAVPYHAMCEYALRNEGREKAPVDIASLRDVDRVCLMRQD